MMLLQKRAAIRQEEINFASYLSDVKKYEQLDDREREILSGMDDWEKPVKELMHQYFNYKVDRVKARFDTEFKRQIGETVCSNEQVMSPKYDIGSTMFVASLVPRLFSGIS